MSHPQKKRTKSLSLIFLTFNWKVDFICFRRIKDQIKNAFWDFSPLRVKGKSTFQISDPYPKTQTMVFKAKKKEDEIMDVSPKRNLIVGLRLVIHDVFCIYLNKMNAFFSSLLFCLNLSNHACLLRSSVYVGSANWRNFLTPPDHQ